MKTTSKLGKTKIFHIVDDDPDTSYLEQEMFAYRKTEYQNGDFCFMGIRAETEILTSYNGKEWLINSVSSGGLYGIESDSGDEYILEVKKEQLSELKDVLISFGFSEKQIQTSFDNAECVEK